MHLRHDSNGSPIGLQYHSTYYDADMRGGISRGYEPWAADLSKKYWNFWR